MDDGAEKVPRGRSRSTSSSASQAAAPRKQLSSATRGSSGDSRSTWSVGSTRSRLPTPVPAFKKSDFVASTSEFEIDEGSKSVLGRGMFSVVRRAKFRGVDCCVKIIEMEAEEYKEAEKYFLAEMALLRSLLHPHILEYYGAHFEASPKGKKGKNTLKMFTELMHGGSLHAALRQDFTPPRSRFSSVASRLSIASKKTAEQEQKPLCFSWMQRLRAALHTSDAVRFLHSNRVMHRDIKSENVLLSDTDADGPRVAKLCDFGFARGLPQDGSGSFTEEVPKRTQFMQKHDRQLTLCGTDDFMAPEIIFSKPYSKSADVFSFGCVLVEMVCGRAPGGGSGRKTLSRLPQNGFSVDADDIRSAAIAGCPPSLAELAVQCCSYEPDERPSAEDVFEWISDLCAEWEENEASAPDSPSGRSRGSTAELDPGSVFVAAMSSQRGSSAAPLELLSENVISRDASESVVEVRAAACIDENDHRQSVVSDAATVGTLPLTPKGRTGGERCCIVA